MWGPALQRRLALQGDPRAGGPPGLWCPPSSRMGLDVTRPDCLGLAVREAVQALPSQCPALPGGSGQAGEGGSVPARPCSVTRQSRGRQGYFLHCWREAGVESRWEETFHRRGVGSPQARSQLARGPRPPGQQIVGHRPAWSQGGPCSGPACSRHCKRPPRTGQGRASFSLRDSPTPFPGLSHTFHLGGSVSSVHEGAASLGRDQLPRGTPPPRSSGDAQVWVRRHGRPVELAPAAIPHLTADSKQPGGGRGLLKVQHTLGGAPPSQALGGVGGGCSSWLSLFLGGVVPQYPLGRSQ